MNLPVFRRFGTHSLLTLLCALQLSLSSWTTASAVTLAERSPFAQGVWWDPATSGSGFEMFSNGRQVAVLWYTFDAAGKPVWYLAQGNLSDTNPEPWPLQSHRWENGRQAAPVIVGSLRLTVHHPELAEVNWELNGAKGTSAIKPLILSGVVREVDRSGAWFNPDNPGWGLSLMEQGPITAGGLYTYDALGQPTWFSGHDSNKDGLKLFAYSGACPSCVYRAPTLQPVGRVDFQFKNETAMTLRSQLSRGLAPGVNLDQSALVQLSRPASTRSADRRLASFTSDVSLKQHLDAGMLNLGAPVVPPITGVSFSSSPISVSASPRSVTNVQEAGVDEADLVKSDGQNLYTFSHDAGGVRNAAIRVLRIGASGESVTPVAEIPLGANKPEMGKAGLYLTDDRLVSVSGTNPFSISTIAMWVTPASWRGGTTHVEVFDTRSGGTPSSLWNARLSGQLIASRRIGNRLLLVTRHVPDVAGFSYGTTVASQIDRNRNLLASTSLASLLPTVRVNGGSTHPLVKATDVYSPPQGARKTTADMFVVTVIDLKTPRIQESLSILGTIDTLYASTNNLYLVGSRYNILGLTTSPFPPEPSYYLTDVHQIRLDGERLVIAGTGTVEGFIDNKGDNAPYRLSERDGRLRIVTSSSNMWGGDNKNRLTILEPSSTSPGLLKTLSYLPNETRTQPLGKPGELLYGTRFMDDRLYAVTFRRIDPLYTIDLSNPADPRIEGELEVMGYSDYLHPLPNGLLLGVGKDARASQTSGDGPFVWFQGLQVSLFDVSNIRQPRELQRLLIGKRGSESAVLSSPLAFSSLQLADGSTRIGIPAVIHDTGSTQGWSSSDSMTYPWQHSGLLRFSVSGTSPATARLTQEETLVSHSVFSQLARHPDSYGTTARSILFPASALYISNGRVWQRSSAGAVTGPY